MPNYTSLKDTLLGLNDNFPDGSALSYSNGADISTNPQATIGNPQSIHSDGYTGNSYSLNGNGAQGAQNIYNAYNDGDDVNPVPQPSQLDINNGFTPSTYRANKPLGSQNFPSFS